MVVQQLSGRCMGENKKEEANVEMTKEVAFAVSSSSVSDSSCDTTLPKQASLHGRTTGPTRRSTKGGWTEEEDDILTKVVKTFNGKNWKKIAEYFPGRSDVQCLHRWQKVLNPDLVKGPWTKEEDDRIIELVGKYGCKKWSVIAQSLPGRIGKQCRERWHNHLNPAIKKDAWTKDEEMALIRAHQIYGNKWAEIARYLPGRADNSIKNHWNCSVKKKLDSYSASGLASDIPCVGIPDSNSNGRREQYIKPKLSTLSLGAVGFKISGKDDISSCLDVSLLGNSKGGEKDPHSNPVKIENSVFLKEVDDMRRLSPAIQCDEKGAPSSNLISNHPEVHANNASMSDDLCSSTIHHTVSYGMSLDGSTNIFSPRCSRGPMDHINCLSPRYSSEYITLGTFTNVPAHANFSSRKKIISPGIVFPVPANRLHESPEKSCQFPSPISGSGSMGSRFNSECNYIPSSMSICEFGSDTGGVHRQGKVPALHVQSEEMSSCSLFYNSPPLNNLAHGGSSSTKNCIQQTGSLADFSTPPSCMRSISVNGSNPDPDLILRNAAKSFTTPSIIRKRKRATSRVVANGNGHNGFCTPDVRSSRNKDMQDSTYSCPPVCGGQYDLNSTDLSNVKWLSLSPQSSLQPDTSSKSLEKCLEHEFDMEWDKSKAKCSTSAIASNSSDTNQGTNTGFTPLDNSPDSLGVGSDQNSIHVDSSGNCNSIT